MNADEVLRRMAAGWELRESYHHARDGGHWVVVAYWYLMPPAFDPQHPEIRNEHVPTEVARALVASGAVALDRWSEWCGHYRLAAATQEVRG